MSTAPLPNYVMALPDYTPVVPDPTGLDLPGQFQSMPGGYSNNGSAIVADGAGTNAVYTDPTVNPSPTGGWMQVASSVMNLAAQGMKTYSQGTPTPAIPAARKPVSMASTFALTTPTGQTNWLLVGGVVVVGVGAMFALAMIV
jgi:hypothetical protein